MNRRTVGRRNSIAEIEEEPGTYRKVQHAGGFYYALLSCPVCGRVSSLKDHTVEENGEVNPSVVCGYEGCTFHEWVTLIDWQK